MELDVLLKLFDNRLSSKLLVVLALFGLALSFYSVNQRLDDDVEKKIRLIKEWKEIGSDKALSPEAIEAVYDQLLDQLEQPAGGVESFFLSAKNNSNGFLETLALKFVTGALLFLFVYGVNVMWLLFSYRGKGKIKHLLLARIYYVYIFLALGTINALIPFVSVEVNYLFFPSILTLVFAIVVLLKDELDRKWKEAMKNSNVLLNKP